MRAVIVASGAVALEDERWLTGAELVVAADGGAAWLDRLGRRPDALVGDLDSAEPELVARLDAAGTRIERHAADKDASDTELAVEHAIREGATDVVLLGATGGERIDHELANLLLLADASFAGLDLRAVHGRSVVRALRGGGGMALSGRVGDLVTLLPIGGDARGVTTGGLRWALDRALLRMGRSRGLSNEVASVPASVGLEEGVLLVVETAIEGSSP